ncbi:hypothetical protein NL478_27720, partial [Klebsiella pneumoniae]|nr:hypothetical protein [Klebsiella pneumoniae]
PGKPFFGPWSVPGSVSCVLPGFPLILNLVIWSCLFIVLTTVSTYWGKRLWKKYKIMSHVEIILPPALNVRFERDRFHDFD